MKSSGGRARRIALGTTFALGSLALGFATPALLTGCEGRPGDALELGVVEQVEQQVHGSGTCIADMWTHAGNKQDLQCTANDVRVARATNICIDNGDGTETCQVDADGGTNDLTCQEGETVTFTADFEVVLTAQDRYDVGVYFATDGGGTDGALTGQCSGNIITNSNNTTNFVNNDATTQPGDTCGDIDSDHNPQIMRLEITTLCETEGEDRQLSLPYCTSWRQPGSNELCDDIEDAYPGSPSKCSCDEEFTIAITVEDLDATVTKSAVEACVTYDVGVSNDTESRDMTLTTLDDDVFGDITDASNANLCWTTCGQAADDAGMGGAGALPVLLEPGDSYSCSFAAKTVYPGSDDPVTDVVTASFQGADATETFSQSGRETVIVDLDVTDPPETDAGP